ncbi:hypothetical protein [Seongchinamella sediminis]|nr:hypothetical protein [Seongchinamella sediminis]
MGRQRPHVLALAACMLWAGFGGRVLAEPYIAVRSGQPCHACHSNSTGGGMRNTVGYVYGRNVLSVRPLLEDEREPEWDVLDGIRLGGNARYSARQFEADDADGNLEFVTDRVSLYGQVRLNRVVDFYVDQQVAPGGSLNRETWGRASGEKWYLKAGKFFLPYGWRLEDDSAYIREATGINFFSPDNGMEVGYTGNSLQAQASVTNGNGGAGERDDGKFFLGRLNWIGRFGQLGINAGLNDFDDGERMLAGITAGFNTGPVTWLAEYDRIEDELNDFADEEQDLALVETNWLIVRGHNLKLTLEWQDFKGGGDRNRASVVWEYFPWSHTQLRVGYRAEQTDDLPFPDEDELFVQAHLYF